MKELKIKVEGMICNGCENRVQNAVKTIKGVEKVISNHTKGIVEVTINDEIDEKVVKEKIEDIGFKVCE